MLKGRELRKLFEEVMLILQDGWKGGNRTVRTRREREREMDVIEDTKGN